MQPDTTPYHLLIDSRLAEMKPITLEELDRVEMLNRIDTKFVFHIKYLEQILQEITPHYYVLEIDGKRKFQYESLYFDTDDYLLYRFHHNGKFNRLKVRYRKYLDSGLCYFEVKYKVKGTRTDKRRIREDDIHHHLSTREMALIEHDYLDANSLKEKMAICFTRITLANSNFRERLTIDTDVLFDNFREKKTFPELVVAEVKSDKYSSGSPMIHALKKRHIDELPFSKYATAVAMLEDVKNNNFKPNFLKINRILHGNRT
ncbi:MAG: polyphosphate polymerase domain-containing protein [Chitinophagales bacterium]|nr:polyphosphate polymerase domain-containing protein [Chitinophagales bacterium]MDW8417960.1 polyphosphate polymerase domain-containing protein [Chitinophagales bacterium]